MKTITLNIKKIIVVQRKSGPDKVVVEFDAETPFPELGYAPSATIDTRHGFGLEWCRNVLGHEPSEIIRMG